MGVPVINRRLGMRKRSLKTLDRTCFEVEQYIYDNWKIQKHGKKKYLFHTFTLNLIKVVTCGQLIQACLEFEK